MNRMEKRMEYGYGTNIMVKYNTYEDFIKHGVVKLKEYEPFESFQVPEIVEKWFNDLSYKEHNHDDFLEDTLLVTLPETLHSIDNYVEEKRMLSTPIAEDYISDGIGLKEGCTLYFLRSGLIHFATIYDNNDDEVKYLFFKKSNAALLHKFYFTPYYIIKKNQTPSLF